LGGGGGLAVRLARRSAPEPRRCWPAGGPPQLRSPIRGFPRSLNPNPPPPPRPPLHLSPPIHLPRGAGGGVRTGGIPDHGLVPFARPTAKIRKSLLLAGKSGKPRARGAAPAPAPWGTLRCRGRRMGFGRRRRRVWGDGEVCRSGRPAGRRRSGSAAGQPAWPRSAARRSANPPLPEPKPASASSSAPPSLPARPPSPGGGGRGAGAGAGSCTRAGNSGQCVQKPVIFAGYCTGSRLCGGPSAITGS
jgi:translation initiation factor IF-2